MKRGKDVLERIIVQISRYLSEALAAEIARAQWHSDAPVWVNRLRRDIFDEDADGACFEVVARTAGGEAVGRLHCIRNRQDPTLWYYGDLFVVPAYRRSGIALLMLEEAKNHLLEIGARRLRCYVEPQNTPSLRLQEKAGFLEKPFENFNHLQNEGRIMLECELPLPFTVIPATADKACFVFGLYAQNRTALHASSITLSEWRELLACGDADEAHFLICKGAMPAAYMKLNGLLNTDTAYLSMLFVAKRHQREGICRFAVGYAERFLAARGFAAVGVQTTADNLPAQALYKACGSSDVSSTEAERRRFVKRLNEAAQTLTP